MFDEIKDVLDKKDIKESILVDPSLICNEFKSRFSTDINTFIDKVYDLYLKINSSEKLVNKDERKELTIKFVWYAYNCLINSFSLLTHGYLDVSGNLMRSFFESISIAILIKNKIIVKDNNADIDILDKLKLDLKGTSGKEFRYNKAFKYILDNQLKIGFDIDVMNNLKKVYESKHNYSHPTFLNLSFTLSMSINNIHYIGVGYDKGKENYYKKEIDEKIDAVGFFDNIMNNLITN